jgi:hypothetical protein
VKKLGYTAVLNRLCPRRHVLVLVLVLMLANMQILETCRVLIGVEDKH